MFSGRNIKKMEKNLDSYTREKLTINMLVATVFSLVIFVLVFAVFIGAYYLIYGMEGIEVVHNASWIQELVFLFALVAGVVLHELVHGICWSQCVDGGWKTIKFGVMWKSLSPYCHCSEPMKVRNYKFGALAPLFVVGVFPAVISLLVGSFGLLLFGAMFIAGAAGDIMVVWTLRHTKADDYVEDHPSEAGCWIYREKTKIVSMFL